MKCPKCNSENVRIESKEYKPKLTVPIIMVCCGLGLMFFGIGVILGAIVGVIIAAIVNSLLPQTYRGVIVCQDCGFASTNKTIVYNPPNPLFCTPDECNLMIVRKSNSIGSVCKMEIRIDGFSPFILNNCDVKHIKLENGMHKVSYRQVNGMGKQQRTGSVDVNIDENRRLVQFDFLHQGVNVIIQ